ncbi:hypothetical protein HPB47_003893 [Ixodes persulcatus]|uniref:Uncharacterized protein n=1 Tax=Ixodes persulcatus TaxID=34615 RepID=A0AC60PH72_IXOPE|nr:hypothetical protein HPB47_003893 [Ixodes persulcatus]
MNEEPDEASLFYTASEVQFTDPRRAPAYFKVKPAGLFSWQIPPCSDFYGFVCTEDMLNQSYPGWRSFKQASVGFLYQTVDFLGDVDTAISQVSLFVRNCSRQQDREANQKDALLNVLASVGLGGFPYLEGDAAASVRLDDVVAAALRLLDVAPFFKVLVVNDKAGFGNAILLTTRTPALPTLELLRLSKQFDHLLKTWWTLRDLLPILQSQSSADIEALLNIFRDLTRWNWLRALNALFGNITTFSDQSSVTMSDREYFAELARVLDQYEPRHLLNFVGLSIADSHVTFLSDKYTKVKDFAYMSYHDTSLPLREQLCLRFAERICPMGVEALLLQALTRSSVREDLIKEARLGNVAEMKIKILFSDLLHNTSMDLKTIDCGVSSTEA